MAKLPDYLAAQDTAVKPASAPVAADTSYSWFAGAPVYNPLVGNPFNTAAVYPSMGTPTPYAPVTTPIASTTSADYSSSVSILYNKLIAAGIPASTAEKAKTFFSTLLGDGISIDNAIDYFYYQKNYTSKSGVTYESPYATDFGKFNDGLTVPKSPNELVNWVLGIRNTGVKYNLGAAYTDDTAIAKLIKNNVTVKDFDARANEAQLKAITADPNYTNALKNLGYISSPQDLTGFFLNPDIAQTEFDRRLKTAAFGAEAVRNQVPGMTFDKSFIEKQAADLAAQGYSEAEISAIAQKGFGTVAANLLPATTVAGIYRNAVGNVDVQNALQQQAFNKVNNQQLQTAAQMNIGAFSGSAGTSGTSTYLRKTSLQQTGAETPFQY